MKTNLLLSPKTLTQLNEFVGKPSHGLLILGASGCGKLSVSLLLASQILGLKSSDELARYPYFYHLARGEKRQEIAIDEVRQLISNLRLKTPGARQLRRVVVIEDSQNLSSEAQSALLKILEEAPEDTVFLLTAVNSHDLLPTIASRLQKLQVYPLSLKQALAYYSANFDPAVIESTWILSQGSAGLLNAILFDIKNHPLKKAVDDFKRLLREDSYGRLAMLDKLTQNKPELVLLLDAGSRVMAALQKQNLKRGNTAQVKKILNARSDLLESIKKLEANTSPRLVILSLALSLEV